MSTKFHFRVHWSEEDEAYIGTCREYPNLSWVADTREEALEGIQDVVESEVESEPQRFWLTVALLAFIVVFAVFLTIDLLKD